MMGGTFNPFDPDPPQPERKAADLHRVRQDRVRETQQVLGTPAGRAWLTRRQQAEQATPSYQPGDRSDVVAWREGRKAMLRELQQELDTTLTEKPPA